MFNKLNAAKLLEICRDPYPVLYKKHIGEEIHYYLYNEEYVLCSQAFVRYYGYNSKIIHTTKFRRKTMSLILKAESIIYERFEKEISEKEIS